MEAQESIFVNLEHDFSEATEKLAVSLVLENILSYYVLIYLSNVRFKVALTLTYNACQAACHTKSKTMWWRVAVGIADDKNGVGIVIAPYYTNIYSRRYIDSLKYPLSTDQDHERTVEHIFCVRL